MKRITSLLLLIFVHLLLAQEGIRFETDGFQELLAKAKKENKLVFIDAYAVWCGPCKIMDKSVFPKKAVGEYYNTHFINAKIDMEKGEGRDIAKKYNVYSYPTYLFLTGDGELVRRGRGAMSEDKFIEMGKEINQISKKYNDVRERFEKGESNLDFLKEAIKLYADKDYEFAKRVSERYFSLKSENLSREEMMYLIYFVKSVKDENYEVLVSLRDEIEKEFSKKFYRELNQEIILADVAKKSVDMEQQTFDELFFRVEAMKLLPKEEAEEATDRMKMNFFRATDNYPKYENAVLSYYGIGEETSLEELIEVANIIASKSTSKPALEQALHWIEKDAKPSNDYKVLYVLAKLYSKLGDKKSAKIYAEKSLDIAKKISGVRTTPIEMLLKEIAKE